MQVPSRVRGHRVENKTRLIRIHMMGSHMMTETPIVPFYRIHCYSLFKAGSSFTLDKRGRYNVSCHRLSKTPTPHGPKTVSDQHAHITHVKVEKVRSATTAIKQVKYKQRMPAPPWFFRFEHGVCQASKHIGT